VVDVQLAREVGEEDDACLQGCDEDGAAFLVVVGDLVRELRDPPGDLLGGEVPVADPRIGD
jgi:hypothetical protein